MNFLKKLFAKNTDIELSEGDIFYTSHEGKFYFYKLLKIDNDNTYHVMGYTPLDALPQKEEISSLEIQIFHFPLAKTGFTNPILLTKSVVTEDDLSGYKEYLRLTHQDNDTIEEANKFYQAAYNLTDENKREEAIISYSRAIELAPGFFQAFDNRAFCKMELGLWNEAINDFKQSLVTNPNSVLAEFSIGECYLRLGDCAKAKERFEKALSIDPTDENSKMFLRTAIECIEKASEK